MRRNYTVVDLVRFAQLSKERAGEKPIDLLKEYDKLYPELSSKQKYENLLKALGLKGDELKRAMEIPLHESSGLRKHAVINQRELLLAFCDHLNEYPGLEEVRFDFMMQDFIDKSQ